MAMFATPEQAEAIEALRRFLARDVAPVVARYRDRTFPKATCHALLKALIPFGFVTGWVPEADGGTGIDAVTSGMLYEELARVSPDLAGTAFIAQGTTANIHEHGAPALRARLLPGLLAADLIPSSGITEPGVGSNPREIATKAIPEDDDLVVTGEKTWVSNADIADLCVVVARTGANAFTRIVVERAAGYETRELGKIGLKSWSTGQVFLSGVRVPRGNVLGAPGEAMRGTQTSIVRARCFTSVFALGIARAALDAALAYATERRQWGRPVGGHQLVQAMLAESATELEASRLLVFKALALLDRNEPADAASAMAKAYATEAAVRIASRSMQVHGAYGLSPEYGVERHLRDARMLTIPDGTTQINTLILGRALTGFSAFG